MKPRTGQDEATLYIGHGEYSACYLLREGQMYELACGGQAVW